MQDVAVPNLVGHPLKTRIVVEVSRCLFDQFVFSDFNRSFKGMMGKNSLLE